MKKFLLTLAFFLSFAVISRSDPPAGYQEKTYTICVKNVAEQYIEGATAVLSNSSWVVSEGTSLTSNDEGIITIHFVYPNDPDDPVSVSGIQVTISATGYEDFVIILGSAPNMSIRMRLSH